MAPALAQPFHPIDLQALGAVARGDLDALGRIAAESAFDADRLAAFAAEHHLAGLVHAVIHGTPVRAALPDGARRRLTAAFVRQWATNERLARELRELAQAFDAAAIPFILLKGLHFALAYGGGLERRGMADLDVLVRRRDVDPALSLLERLGYRRRARFWLGAGLTSMFTHACELDRGGIPLDLHWTLVRHPSYRIDADDVWQRRQGFDAHGARVQVLDDEHALTFQALAAAKDLELGTVTLKTFVDLYAIARCYEEREAWEPFFAARTRERTARATTAMLALAHSLVGRAGELPGLVSCLSHRPPPAVPAGLAERIARRSRSWRDRLWTLRLHEIPLLAAGAWWALSLPFRIAAHRPAPETAP